MFSQHARERLLARTRLREEEVTRMLDRGRYTRFGRSTCYLLWSPRDWSVCGAVQDAADGTIITVLSEAMIRDVECSPEDAFQRAVNKMVYHGLVPRFRWAPTTGADPVVISVVSTERAVPIRIGTFPTVVTTPKLSGLPWCHDFLPWVATHAAKNHIDLGTVHSLLARLPGFPVVTFMARDFLAAAG
ncbi:MAG TPA: hypothetical protein VFQ88_13990 [Nevskiaceae bacterium]|nr:hypothetical protein [Nevskiaceae bacterium]